MGDPDNEHVTWCWTSQQDSENGKSYASYSSGVKSKQPVCRERPLLSLFDLTSENTSLSYTKKRLTETIVLHYRNDKSKGILLLASGKVNLHEKLKKLKNCQGHGSVDFFTYCWWKYKDGCLYFKYKDSATPWTIAHPGSSAHGSLQPRILEWAAVPFSRESSQPRDGLGRLEDDLEFPIKLNMQLPTIHQLSLDIHPREWKLVFTQKPIHEYLQQLCL